MLFALTSPQDYSGSSSTASNYCLGNIPPLLCYMDWMGSSHNHQKSWTQKKWTSKEMNTRFLILRSVLIAHCAVYESGHLLFCLPTTKFPYRGMAINGGSLQSFHTIWLQAVIYLLKTLSSVIHEIKIHSHSQQLFVEHSLCSQTLNRCWGLNRVNKIEKADVITEFIYCSKGVRW